MMTMYFFRAGMTGALLTTLLAIVLAVSFAPNAHAVEIGYVDALRLIELAPQGKVEVKQLEAEFAERSRELKGRLEQFKAANAELENKMDITTEQRDSKTRELREMQRRLRRDQREYNEDFERRRSEKLGQLEKTITIAIITVAKREKLDVVFQQAVYVSPDIDLTEQVLAELEKLHKAAQ